MKVFLVFVRIVIITLLLFACTSPPETQSNVGPDPLDAAIRSASDYLNGRLSQGIKLVFLNFQSDSPALSEYIIDGLIENTVNDGLFIAVDRQNLTIIQQEMNFQLSGEVSDESAQAIGKLLGAQVIVSGTISPLGNSYRLRVRAISVETAEIQGQFNRDIDSSPRLLALIANSSTTLSQSGYPAGNVAASTQTASSPVNTALTPSALQTGNDIASSYERFTELRVLDVQFPRYARGPVVFTPDSKGIINLHSQSSTNYLTLWDVETGKAIRRIRESTSFNSIAISPDGTRLITGHGRSIRLWDIATGAYRECTGYSGNVNSLAYSPDGRFFISSAVSGMGISADNTIRVWDAGTGQEVMSLTGHTGNILSIAYSPNGQQIVSCSVDKTIKLWEVASGRILLSISADCSIVDYSPDGRRIAAVEGSNIHIFDSQNGRELYRLTGHRNRISAITFSPDGNRLLSAAQGPNDNSIIIWNMSNGWEIGRLDTRGGARGTSAIAISPDGNFLTVVKPEDRITIWGME